MGIVKYFAMSVWFNFCPRVALKGNKMLCITLAGPENCRPILLRFSYENFCLCMSDLRLTVCSLLGHTVLTWKRS